MGKKYTIEFIRAEFEKEGYTLLSKEYVNSKTHLEYVCPEGHIWSITWNNWQHGHRCMECSGSKKLTIEFIKKEFKKENYKLLTKEYINNRQKLKYICPKEHEGTICWHDWQAGNRCFGCYGNKRLTIEFVKEQFKKEGYVCLSTEYVNSWTFLEYTCPKGHPGSISWNSWQQGSRCFDCSGKKKFTIEFILSEFQKEGYTLLSKKYINSKTLLKYSCPKGHLGSIIWSSWGRGFRCKICSFENISGENSPNWNPNLINEDRLDRRLILEYRSWSYKVKKKRCFYMPSLRR